MMSEHRGKIVKPPRLPRICICATPVATPKATPTRVGMLSIDWWCEACGGLLYPWPQHEEGEGHDPPS